MKTIADITTAREVVAISILEIMSRPKSSRNQKILTLLNGMSVALCWVAETPNGQTLQALIDGKPIE